MKFGIIFALASMAAMSPRASAVPITYTLIETGLNGTVGGTSFTNQTLTLQVTTDTSLISFNGVSWTTPLLPGSSGAILLTGTGPGTLSDTFNFFDNQGNSIVGMQDGGTSYILGETAGFAATYAMVTAVATTSGTPFFDSGATFPSSIGTLVLTSASGDSFSATLGGGVPEPGTLALALAGMGALVCLRKRPHRRTLLNAVPRNPAASR